ncbi:CoA transferase [Actinomadura rudentiformis]|uniref:CoA transferase n=1 Tax=Actinomadura rudentiformis TaxID=359158 RepID=UPI001CEF89DE|nr:CoA transferase [Actinomadura rudentiformis]
MAAVTGAPAETSPWETLETWCSTRKAEEIVARTGLLGLAASRLGERAPTRLDERALTSPLPDPRMDGRDLTGSLVVDFSALWAGPLCAHLLQLAGAAVVKVETPTRPDGARRGHRGFYDLLHAGQRSVVLDPERSSELRDLQSLVRRADVVIEASRPRALARWGLDADSAAGSGTIWVSITAYGRACDRVGFGDDVAAAAGLVAWDPETREPVFCGDAIADPLTGLYAAHQAMSALARRRGALLDIAMVDVARWAASPSWRSQAKPVENAPGLPAPRTAPGIASESGEDTEVVLSELGIRQCS